jgi:hypothetical protein
MRTRRNLVTGIAAAVLALTACGMAAGCSGGTPAGHAAAASSAGHAPAVTWVTEQGDIARVKRHIVWGGAPAGAQRPQAGPGPSEVTDRHALAKVKRDVVLHAEQQARGR